MKLAGTSKRRTPRRVTRLRCLATRKVNQDDAVTAACTSRYGRSVDVQRRSACPISFLFFRACSYPRPRRETCPRGKQVCSTAKLDKSFLLPAGGLRETRPANLSTLPRRGCKFGQLLARPRHSSA